MRFLIDANLPRSTVELIARLGHEVDFARDIGLGSAPDAQIAARDWLSLTKTASDSDHRYLRQQVRHRR